MTKAQQECTSWQRKQSGPARLGRSRWWQSCESTPKRRRQSPSWQRYSNAPPGPCARKRKRWAFLSATSDAAAADGLKGSFRYFVRREPPTV